jgi:hypothetical protein
MMGSMTERDPLPGADVGHGAEQPEAAQRLDRRLAVMVVIGVLAVNLAVSLPGLSTSDRQVADTDGYMRLVRVRELVSGEVGWFESWAPRANAPFGHSMHWTRPLDALIVAASGPVRLFASSDDALYWGALLLIPVLHALLGLAVGWAALPLVGRRAWIVAALGVVVQPALLAYGGVGRVDHHILILLLFALLAGSSIRFLVSEKGSAGRAATAAGGVAGVGLWVSTEFLLPIGLTLAAGIGTWVLAGGDHARRMTRFSTAWLIATTGALVLERGLSWEAELDRISVVHVVLAAGSALVWLVVSWVAARGAGRRAATLAGVATPMAAAFVLLFPGFLRGPFGDVPSELWDAWLSRVVELQPLWPFGPNPIRTLYLIGAPASGLVIAWWGLGRATRITKPGWAFLAISLLVTTVVGLAQLRQTAFAQILAPIPWAWAGGRALERVGEGASLRSVVLRVGAMVFGVSGFLVPVVLASLLQAPEADGGPPAEECSVMALARFLDEVAEAAGEPPIVLANPDFGPEILYRSQASVVADPYHRNIEGILEGRAVLVSKPDQAAELVRAREIEAIAVCPVRDRAYLRAGTAGAVSLIAELLEGTPPAWIDASDIRQARDSGFVVFRVVAEGPID